MKKILVILSLSTRVTAFLIAVFSASFAVAQPPSGKSVAVSTVLTAGTGSGITWYVAPAPFGNDSVNTGFNPLSPFQSVLMAEQFAKYGDTIHLMDGTNVVGSPLLDLGNISNNFVELGNGINWYSEPNAWLVISNWNQGSAQDGYFCPFGNNMIYGLNLLIADSDTVGSGIGVGDNDTIQNPSVSRTNVVFVDLNCVSYGTAIHFELANPRNRTNSIVFTFINPVITANACPIVIEAAQTNVQVKIIGGDITENNFTNIFVGNTKPLRGVDVENVWNARSLICQGTAFHISDTDLSGSNRPAYWIWTENRTGDSVATFNGCTIDWLTMTNPASLDISTNALGSLNVYNCVRRDGQQLTYPAGNAPNFGPVALGGAPSVNIIANTLIASSNLWGNDRAMIFSFTTTAAAQQSFSNYATITLSQSVSTNPVVVTMSPEAYGIWTNSNPNPKPIPDCFQAVTTSNSITLQSLASPAVKASYSIAIHVDQP